MTSVTTLPGSVPTGAAARPAAVGGIADIGDPTKMPDHEVTFSDVLSTLNPLQYIPVIGSIYRAVTGDTISPAAQVLGGALLGGPLGLVASAANAVLEQATGEDVGDRMIAWLIPDSDKSSPQATQYAANTTPTPAASAPASAATQSVSPAPKATPPSGSSPDAPKTGTQAPPAATAAASPAAPSTTTVASATAADPVAVQAAAAAAQSTRTSLPRSGGAGVAGAVKAPGSGWTLADYRAFAGHGMPPPAGANGAQLHNTPIPLQTTVPLPGSEGTVHAPVVPALVQTPANVAPTPTTTATAQQQDTWVSQAMMRGLDRYRDMLRQQEQQQQPSSDAQQQAPKGGLELELTTRADTPLRRH